MLPSSVYATGMHGQCHKPRGVRPGGMQAHERRTIWHIGVLTQGAMHILGRFLGEALDLGGSMVWRSLLQLLLTLEKYILLKFQDEAQRTKDVHKFQVN